MNREEAQLLTGEHGPGAAAERLVEMGAELVAVTLGADGALLRGAVAADAPGRPGRRRRHDGRGRRRDRSAGRRARRRTAYSAQAAADALPAAVAAAARATEGWGAIDALPDAIAVT